MAAGTKKGWIGIYAGPTSIETHTTGSQPYLVHPRVRVEVQVASTKSGEDAEDRLENAIEEIWGVMAAVANRTLGGYVGTSIVEKIEREYNADTQIWHYAGILTIKGETRA
ncbi:MAG: hypothetical protein JRC86_12830 [Deltaproteobacteria bacterium]|nr:hypothetical protein [Deltaproteobacteria bacterium]